MSSLGKMFESCKNSLYKNYGENPGTMLVHTGVLGWILSAMAQVGAVVFNDKISKKEKSFLIPQEIADACVNIASFYLVTNSVKKMSSKLISTGKLATKPVREFLEKQKIDKQSIGKIDFNIEKLDKFSEIKKDYTPFKNGVEVLASVAGSVLSCNVITPICRNKIASNQQKKTLQKMKHYEENKPASTNNYSTTDTPQYKPNQVRMADFQKMSITRFSSSSSLKI
ncbi:MAG: hypothetical protein R3Y28_03515 [Candidatus Gastranaerophilales bacterium]